MSLGWFTFEVEQVTIQAKEGIYSMSARGMVPRRAGNARTSSHLACPGALLGGKLHNLFLHRQPLAPPHRVDQALGQV